MTFQEIESYLGLAARPAAGPSHPERDPAQDLHELRHAGRRRRAQATPEAVAAAVHTFLHPDVPVERAPRSAHDGEEAEDCRTRTISVLVLNAGNVTGEASNTSYRLGKHGFATKTLPTVDPANAPTKTRDTVVYYDPAQANGAEGRASSSRRCSAPTRASRR